MGYDLICAAHAGIAEEGICVLGIAEGAVLARFDTRRTDGQNDEGDPAWALPLLSGNKMSMAQAMRQFAWRVIRNNPNVEDG